tara:strand:- start:945 stop:1238 length:294 start_codon:yes stop_codon:yes gene_type:complete
MEIWKSRPGLEGTLMRTTYRRNWYDDEILWSIHKKNLEERYKNWIQSDEAKISASNAILECYLNYKIRKNNCYKKLYFIQLDDLSIDIIYELSKYIK